MKYTVWGVPEAWGQCYSSSMNSGKIGAGRDGTRKSKVLQEVLADPKSQSALEQLNPVRHSQNIKNAREIVSPSKIFETRLEILGVIKDFPGSSKIFQIIQKLSRPFGNFQIIQNLQRPSGHFPDYSKNSRLCGNFSDHPEFYQAVWKLSRFSGTFQTCGNFPDFPGLSKHAEAFQRIQ